MVVEGVGPHLETEQPRWRDRCAQVGLAVPRCLRRSRHVWNGHRVEPTGRGGVRMAPRPGGRSAGHRNPVADPSWASSPYLRRRRGPSPGVGRGTPAGFSLMHRTGHRVVADGRRVRHRARVATVRSPGSSDPVRSAVTPNRPVGTHHRSCTTVTGLPDRVHFSHRLAHASAKAPGRAGDGGGGRCSTSTGSRPSTTRMGHEAGDQVLACGGRATPAGRRRRCERWPASGVTSSWSCSRTRPATPTRTPPHSSSGHGWR